MRILVAGDFHGNADHAGYIVQMAVNHDCDVIFQVGDFGYLPHTSPDYVPNLSAYLKRVGKRLVFIDGNHEAFRFYEVNPRYGRGLFDLEDKTGRSREGFWTLTETVHYTPRGHRWRWGSKVFLSLGGAHSIDRELRLQRERESRKGSLYLWCPQELIRQI